MTELKFPTIVTYRAYITPLYLQPVVYSRANDEFLNRLRQIDFLLRPAKQLTSDYCDFLIAHR